MSAAPRGSFEARAKRPGYFTPEQLWTARRVPRTYVQLASGDLRSPSLTREAASNGRRDAEARTEAQGEIDGRI